MDDEVEEFVSEHQHQLQQSSLVSSTSKAQQKTRKKEKFTGKGAAAGGGVGMLGMMKRSETIRKRVGSRLTQSAGSKEEK